VLAAFFVSGVAGLAHEVAWTRLLRLVMGNSTLAISTVLTVFMGGLALGSYCAGRLIERRDDPLRVFALLEGAIGLYGLGLPWLIDASLPAYRAVYAAAGGQLLVVSVARFAISALLLAVPATLMGATLPVLTHWFAARSARMGMSVGTLYAINTLGAMTGATVTGFLLVPLLGVRATIWTAAGLNALVCAVGLLLHRAAGRAAPVAATAAPADGGQQRRLLLVGYAASGFAALLYEVAWTRVLATMIGSTVYAFSMMLSAFILGLGLGSLVAARFVDRLRRPVQVLALVQAGIGVACLAVVPLFHALPLHLAGWIVDASTSFMRLQLTEFGVLVSIMLVPTLLMGATFPLVTRAVLVEGAGAARAVGAVYSANTVGTILGSFACGFILIPSIGTQNAIYVGVAVNALAALAFHLLVPRAERSRGGRAVPAVILALIVWAVLQPRWDPSRMSFGPFSEARRSPEQAQSVARLRAAIADEHARDGLLFHEEGISTTVTVRRSADGVLSMWVNGKSDASTGPDMATQVLLGHIPLLLHPEPRRVMLVGLASGVSLGAAAQHAVERLDCAEISQVVVEASAFFTEHNHDVLSDPRVRLIVEDGRNHLTMTSEIYDVILSEPSNPWIAGVADLFTREYFETCRERLAPGGVMCTWLARYNLDERSFRSVVRTFAEVFPSLTVWNPTDSDYLLVGSRDRLEVDLTALEERLAQQSVAADLERVGVRGVIDVLGHLLTGERGAARLASGAPLHTDDNALLEFAAPRNLARYADEERLFQVIESVRSPDFSFLVDADAARLAAVRGVAARAVESAGWALRAKVAFSAGRDEDGLQALRTSQQLYPEQSLLPGALQVGFTRVAVLVGGGQVARGVELLSLLLVLDPERPAAQLLCGRLLQDLGRGGEAVAHLERAVEQDPASAEAHDRLAWLLASDPGLRDPRRARALAERAAELTRRANAGVLRTLAVALAALGEFEAAVDVAREARLLATRLGDAELARALEALEARFARRQPL
jgi:spermidine synthase